MPRSVLQAEDVRKLLDQMNELRNENAKLRAALEQYADAKNWNAGTWACLHVTGWHGPDYARAALKGTK